MKSDFVKKLIKEEALNDFKVAFPLENYDIKNSSFYLVKDWDILLKNLKVKYGNKFLLIDLYRQSHHIDSSSFFYNGEDVFIFGPVPLLLGKNGKTVNIGMTDSAHLLFYRGDYWNVIEGDFSFLKNKFKLSFVETFNFIVNKFRINGVCRHPTLEIAWDAVFKDLQFQWNKKTFSYSFDDQNLIWFHESCDRFQIPLIDFSVLQHYRLSYAHNFLKLEDKRFFHFSSAVGITHQQACLMSLMSKIDPKVIKQAISKKQYIKQKEDFKKYLDFNCNLNFNKLTYGQILLIYTLNQKFDLFNFNQKVWKRIINIVKDIQLAFDNDDFVINLSHLLARTPISNSGVEIETERLNDWKLEMFLLIFGNYLKSKSLTKDMIQNIKDIISMRFDITHDFNYDFYFEFFHNVLTSDECEKYIKKIHDKTVEELNIKKAEEIAKKSASLKVVENLLKNTADFEFIPIKNTYDLFLLGEEFHNCVYSRRTRDCSVFYKVIHKDKKYCLECNQTDGVWSLCEIKAPFNVCVKDDIVNKIKSLLEKYNNA